MNATQLTPTTDLAGPRTGDYGVKLVRRFGRKFDAPLLEPRPTLVDAGRPRQPAANCDTAAHANADAHDNAGSYCNADDGAVAAAKWNPSATCAYLVAAAGSGTGTSNPLRVTDTKQ